MTQKILLTIRTIGIRGSSTLQFPFLTSLSFRSAHIPPRSRFETEIGRRRNPLLESRGFTYLGFISSQLLRFLFFQIQSSANTHTCHSSIQSFLDPFGLFPVTWLHSFMCTTPVLSSELSPLAACACFAGRSLRVPVTTYDFALLHNRFCR